MGAHWASVSNQKDSSRAASRQSGSRRPAGDGVAHPLARVELTPTWS